MQEKRKQFSPYSIGTCSILLIFITLSLTTFAALSLVSANSDYTMAQKVAENTTAYYAADTAAQQTVSKLIRQVEQQKESEGFLDSLEEQLSQKKGIQITKNAAQLSASFSVPITQRQSLEVGLVIDENRKVTISHWTVYTKPDSLEEQPLNVWNGTFE